MFDLEPAPSRLKYSLSIFSNISVFGAVKYSEVHLIYRQFFMDYTSTPVWLWVKGPWLFTSPNEHLRQVALMQEFTWPTVISLICAWENPYPGLKQQLWGGVMFPLQPIQLLDFKPPRCDYVTKKSAWEHLFKDSLVWWWQTLEHSSFLVASIVRFVTWCGPWAFHHGVSSSLTGSSAQSKATTIALHCG